jgi:hypothetical protein
VIYVYFVCTLVPVINIAEILLTWNSNQSILIDCSFTSAVFQLYLWWGQGSKQNIYRLDQGRLIDCCFTSNQLINLDLIYVYFVCTLVPVINIAEILLTWNSNQSIDLDLIYDWLIAVSRQQYFSYIYDEGKATNKIYIDQI